MTTTMTITYTRSIRVDGQSIFELQPGDQVDMSINLDQDWCTVERTSHSCTDDSQDGTPEGDYCAGNCHFVVFFEAEDYTLPLHVHEDDEVYARFAAEVPA
jgi:hypothetical protein